VRRPLISFVLTCGLLAVACTGGTTPPELGDPSETSGELPALRGETVDGTTVGPQDYAGHVTVVNFWATWCGPCAEEQPVLQRVWERFEPSGVRFVGVNHQDNHAAAADWVADYGVTYPSIEDPSGSFADDFGFTGLPATFIADAGGELRYQVYGAVNEKKLVGVLERLTGGVPEAGAE
jgi:DsbE subfamily thiol:disulfide oxidoreductase